MKKAFLTKAGAYRIGHEELAGQIVQYDKLGRFGCVKNVYHDGKRICGILSMTDKSDTGLVETDDE